MNIQRVLSAALDSLGRFRATLFPLKNIASEVVRLRKLNSKERKLLYDLVFSWVKNHINLKNFLLKNIKYFEKLSIQEQDDIALNLMAADLGLISNFDMLVKEWACFKQNKSFYLDALGEIVKNNILINYKSLNEANQIAKGLFEAPVQYLAFDQKKIKFDELIFLLKKAKLDIFSSPLIKTAIGIRGRTFNPIELPKNVRDHVWTMDAGSQFIASLIKPKKNDKVLDMCVGNGGKLKYYADDSANFYALDVDEKRINHAKNWLKPSQIKFTCQDAQHTNFPDNFFDWILLDAPCSGTGTIRRHPDIIYRLTQKKLNYYLDLQKKLLEEAIRILAPGGILIYATCSILSLENYEQIDKLLKDTKKISQESLIKLMDNEIYNKKHRLNNHSIHIMPHIDNCDAFFIACLTKNK